MINIFQNEEKIEILEEIQKKLISLDNDSDDAQIKLIFDQIPPNFLKQKEDLKIICELFAIYTRIRGQSHKRNSIKLFQYLIDPMKTYLQDESLFIWNMFGGLFSFKLWMFEEGLISIETIIQLAKQDKTNSIYEFFIPEISENAPDYYENDIKPRLNIEISAESIEKLKEKRQNFFNWQLNSSDFTDPKYREIEDNELRLSIKMDDIDTFQRILSNTNLSVNSSIKESLLENFYCTPCDMKLIEYAMHYKANKIIKFLILNDVEFSGDICQQSVSIADYDLFHFFESKMAETFHKSLLINAIGCWNSELTEYALNNYENCSFFDNPGSEIEDQEFFFDIFQKSLLYLNFTFIRSILFPFLRENDKFVNENINRLVCLSFSERSCFFTREFCKNPNFDANYFFEDRKYSIIGKAIDENNIDAFELLMSRDEINVNKPALKYFTPLTMACGRYSDIKFVKLLCNHPKIELKVKSDLNHFNAIEMSILRGNFYSLTYLIQNVQMTIDKSKYISLIYCCLKQRSFITLKTFLKIIMEKSDYDLNCEGIKKSLKGFSFDNEYNDGFLIEFEKIYNELTNN